MSRRLVTVTVVAALVLVAGAGGALAKGASAATIEGPGGGRVTIDGDGEPGSGETLGRLAEHAGFFAAVYGQEPSVLRGERPPGELGPEYTVRWTLPGPDGDDVIVQALYPDAAGGPVTFMAADQAYWGANRTRGGWYAGGTGLEAVLAEVELPQVPTRRPGLATAALAAAALLAACGTALALSRRRSAALAG